MNNAKTQQTKVMRPVSPMSPSNRTQSTNNAKYKPDSPAMRGLAPYTKALGVMAIIFACLTFVSIIIAVATKIKVVYNGSNLLASFNLVTAFLSIIWIESKCNTTRMITARFWVSISCVIFVAVYLVFQITLLAKCQNPNFLEENPVEHYTCTEEYIPLIGTIVYAGIVQLALISQMVIDLKLRTYIITNFHKQPPARAQ